MIWSTTVRTRSEIVAFGHDADQRLGTGLAHQDAAAFAEPRLGVGNRARHRGSGEGCGGIADAHVLQKLRHRLEGAEGLGSPAYLVLSIADSA